MSSPKAVTNDSVSLAEDLMRDGLPVLAHPFATDKEPAKIKKLINLGVAVEVANSRVSEKANKLAAENTMGVFTAGSDAHLPAEIGNTCIELDVKELSADCVREALVTADGKVCHTPSRKVYRGISQLYRQIDAGKWYRVPDRLAKIVILFIKDISEGKPWH